jgi:hypothetical protein
MTRLRDPIPIGRSRRIGTAAVASVILHGAVAAALAGAALTIAAEAVVPRANGDILMTVESASNSRLLETITSPARPDLSSLLAQTSTTGKGPKSPINDAPTGNSNLAEVLASADAAASTAGAATTSASGAAAALEHTPTGAGVAFAGLTAQGEQARTVVYVIDASGPMISSITDVFDEVNRSVGALLPTQRFGVVIFRDNGAGAKTALFDSELRESSARNRDLLKRWLAGITATGRSNPMDGLRAALALKPQVVFLLSRSITRTGGGVWDRGPQATLEELDRLNPQVTAADGSKARATLIKTIQFQEPDPTGVMQQIAQRHGSRTADGPAYRVLKREELQKR